MDNNYHDNLYDYQLTYPLQHDSLSKAFLNSSVLNYLVAGKVSVMYTA